MTERQELIGLISDNSKDVNGCRLRLNFKALSLEELRAESAYWSRRQREDFVESCRRDAEEAAYDAEEAAVVVVMPTEADEIQDRLEGVWVACRV